MTVYDKSTPVDEPIEVRLEDGFGNVSSYLGSADGGVIRHSLATASGLPESMGNAAGRHARFPRKAVAGWQAEVLAYFEAGVRQVVEVR